MNVYIKCVCPWKSLLKEILEMPCKAFETFKKDPTFFMA